MKRSLKPLSPKKKALLLGVGVVLGLMTCISAVSTLAYFEHAATIANSSGIAVTIGTDGKK